MCGLTGFWSLRASRNSNTATCEWIRNMGATLAHRGPNDAGIWVDDETGLALAHQRLSILDLSPAGHQPMVSASERWVLVFNGEIYNHLELRQALESAAYISGWRGHSDTETLLAGFDAWGIETTLKKSVGMFALALWDRQEQALTLARDRMGEKPLYYGWQDGVFLFGSELKALRVHPAFKGEIDRNALALFLRYNYVPSPYSIYRGIFKLPSGTYLRIEGRTQSTLIGPGEPQAYWSALEVAAQGQANLFRGSDDEAREALEQVLRQSVAGQQIADVPLGAFLSGGIDSSTVVALMQTQSSRPVRTFTIGFDVPGYNEAEYADAVARHLGCDHTELYVRPEEAQAVIPHLAHIYDEPFADSSQIPTFLVAQLARQQVTVALSGDGGDELFGGYNRHIWVPRLWRKLGSIPRPLRRSVAALLLALPPATWNRVFARLGCWLPAQWRYANAGSHLHKLAPAMALATPEAMYRHLISHWDDPAALVPGAIELPTAVTDTQEVA
ncbi:MAG: asparagine synthase (glutamine-hydrolyzing), partial [Candidatus Competibacter sp.]|nr:asparagine synthase (glutamine-hydrolyzing) [Candidatus Competibacter sp.]